MKFVFGRILLLLCSTFLVSNASAYNPFGFKYDHTAITHNSDNPILDKLVGEALTDWGQSSAITNGGIGTDIHIQVEEDSQPIGADGLMWRSDTNPSATTISTCEIRIRRVLYIAAVENGYTGLLGNLVAHEVGHCLGLNHPLPLKNMYPINSIMTSYNLGFQQDDRDGIAFLYPPVTKAAITHKYQLVIAALNKD